MNRLVRRSGVAEATAVPSPTASHDGSEWRPEAATAPGRASSPAIGLAEAVFHADTVGCVSC